jgi:hypothetical protein
MGAITNAKSIVGLFATGTPVGTNVSGALSIGKSSTSTAYDTADILYSFKVLSAATGNVATLTISDGTVAQTTGSPVITDGDGKDFEGVTLGTLAVAHLIHIEVVGTSTGIITVDTSSDTDGFTKFFPAGSTKPLLCSFPASGTITFTFAASGDTIRATILGETA